MLNGYIQIGTFAKIRWGKVILASLIMFFLMACSFYAGHVIPVRETYTPLLLSKGLPVLHKSHYTNTAVGYSFDYPASWKLDTSKANPSKEGDASIVTITGTGGEIFTFAYDTTLKNVQYVSGEFSPLAIGGKDFYEVDANSDGKACVVSATNPVPTLQASCLHSVSMLIVKNIGEAASNDGLTSETLLLHNKPAQITMQLPHALDKNSIAFQDDEDWFHMIVTSIQLPQR